MASNGKTGLAFMSLLSGPAEHIIAYIDLKAGLEFPFFRCPFGWTCSLSPRKANGGRRLVSDMVNNAFAWVISSRLFCS